MQRGNWLVATSLLLGNADLSEHSEKYLKEKMDENEIAAIVVNTVFEMHKLLGPGLLESVYEQILAGKLKKEDYR